jgi:hypothetical protein
MEPIAQSAFVVYLNMSSIDAGSFKQVQKNGKVFYDFENFTGRVGTRLFVTEGSESIEIGRSEESAPDNNTRPGSRKGVTTKKGRSGKRGQKKLSVAALSILEDSSSGSDDSGLMEDSDNTEVLKERLKYVRFMEESKSKSEEEASSKEGDSEAEESSKEESEKEEEGDSEAEESSKEESEKEEGDVERNEASEEQEGKEEAHVPIKNYSAWKKKELEMECRLRDLTSDGNKATLLERLQGNDKEEEVTEHDEDSGQDKAVQEKRTLRPRNTRRH